MVPGLPTPTGGASSVDVLCIRTTWRPFWNTISWHHPQSVRFHCLGWGLRICILKWWSGDAPDVSLRNTLSELSALTKDGVIFKGALYKVYFLPCSKLSCILSSLQVCVSVCEYGQECDMYVSKSQRRTSLLTLLRWGSCSLLHTPG